MQGAIAEDEGGLVLSALTPALPMNRPQADRLSLSRVFAGEGGPQGRVREESARFMASIRGNTALAVRSLPEGEGENTTHYLRVGSVITAYCRL